MAGTASAGIVRGGMGGNTGINGGHAAGGVGSLPGTLLDIFKQGNGSNGVKNNFGNTGAGSQQTGGFMGGQAGQPGTMTPVGGLLNTAQKDPRVEAWQNNLASRYNQIKGKENTVDPFLQESVNNLRNRQSTDTTRRAMDQANAGAADQTAGLQAQMQSQAARTGRGSGWGGAEAQGAGQRLAAKQNAQIQMNELGRQDNLTLQGANILNQPSALQTAQSAQANNFALGSAGLADQGAKLALGQQGLGLEQWKAGNDASYKQALLNQQGQQGMFDNYLKLLGTVGY